MRTLLISAALLAAAGVSQEPAGQDPVPQPPAPSAQAPAKASTAERWIAQLGDERYDKRLEAERRLRELGDDARAALEKAAANDADREVQWRSKRLLRRLDERPAGEPQGLVERSGRLPEADEPDTTAPRGFPRGLPGQPRELDDLRAEFDRLFERFERDFGIDVPRHRFFDDRFFQDLRSQVKAPGNSRGMSVQIGPEGVRVEVQEKGADGELEDKVYEAPDLETFKAQYPGVLEQNGLGLGLKPFDLDVGRLRGRFGPIQRGFGDLDLQPRVLPFDRARTGLQPRPAVVEPTTPPVGARLGVLVKDLPDALRAYLELEDGVGLMVESVQDDTLAQALGLAAEDIVIEINGAKVGSPADVRKALGAIGKGDEVVVDFVRKGRREQARTEKRHDHEPAGEPAGGRLRERVR